MIHRSTRKRIRFRDALAPNSAEKVWPQPKEAGWAKVPRTVAVVLAIARHNTPKGLDPGGTYIEILARNMGEGLVEITSEVESAVLSGLSGSPRGVRSWRERLKALASLGFVQLFPQQGPRIDHVIVLHPAKAVETLRSAGKVPDDLWVIFKRMMIDFGSDDDGLPDSADESVKALSAVLASATPNQSSTSSVAASTPGGEP